MTSLRTMVATMLSLAFLVGCGSESGETTAEPAPSSQQATTEASEPSDTAQSEEPEGSGELFESLVPVMESLDAGGVPCNDPAPIDLGDTLEIRVCADNGPILNRYESASVAAEKGLQEAEIGFSTAQGDKEGLTHAWLQVNNVMVDCGTDVEQCELAQSILGGEVGTFSG